MEKGDIHIGFGIMGGWNQAQAHAQFVANIVDYGMNVQAALEQPRFTKDTFEGCDVEMEETIPAESARASRSAATRSSSSSHSRSSSARARPSSVTAAARSTSPEQIHAPTEQPSRRSRIQNKPNDPGGESRNYLSPLTPSYKEIVTSLIFIKIIQLFSELSLLFPRDLWQSTLCVGEAR